MCEKGSLIEEILEGYGIFERSSEAPDIKPTENHTVLFELPLPEDNNRHPVPKFERHENENDFHNFVKLPCNKESVYYELDDNEEKISKYRWDLIKDSLTKDKIENSHHLSNAIIRYNTKFENKWHFRALHNFFEDELLDEQHDQFFQNIIPKIIDLALQLPELIKSPIPFLKQKKNSLISMSKQQAACLLANAFLCTFPNRNVSRKSTDYPDINFSRLFCSELPHVVQKIKCILYYFHKIFTDGIPTEVITYQRRYIEKFPDWSQSDLKFSSVKWRIDSKNSIETADGMLQVDFANRYLGGGVLGFGCVQEEIRFVICPELIIGMLFCESMRTEETINFYGVETFSKHSGYSTSFKWTGNFVDKTPIDNFRRKKTYIVAMDALCFHKPWMQFDKFLLNRETNKAFCGFYRDPNIGIEKPIPVATGNWGCGAFRGDKHLKCLLQLIACVSNKRNLVYYTFGDETLMNDMDQMFTFLKEKNATIGQLWRCLTTFKNGERHFEELYKYIYENLNSLNSEEINNSQQTDNSQTEIMDICQGDDSLPNTDNIKQDLQDENPSKRSKICVESTSSSILDLCKKLNDKIADNIENKENGE